MKNFFVLLTIFSITTSSFAIDKKEENEPNESAKYCMAGTALTMCAIAHYLYKIYNFTQPYLPCQNGIHQVQGESGNEYNDWGYEQCLSGLNALQIEDLIALVPGLYAYLVAILSK